MRHARAAVLLVAAALASCSTTPAIPAGVALPEAARQAPDHYLVVTVHNDSASGAVPATSTARGYDSMAPYAATSSARAEARAIAADYGLREAASWPIAMLGVHCIVYEMPGQSDRADVLARLARDRRVESAQPLATFTTQTTAYNDPYAGLQHSLDQMAVPQAQEWSLGKGIRVAIIDTGVDTGHPDLQGRIAGHRNFVDDDEAAFRSDLHGTAVAGVIAAVANNHIGIAGIAPGATLLVFKACWKAPTAAGAAICNTFTLAQALAAAIESHVDIVNMSLAGPGDPLLTRIVEHGLRQGIVLVGAAPPAGAHAGFPGGIGGVVTVDAPDRHGGAAAALTAPGREVLTLVPHGHYDFASGSSIAAAQVSGVLALLLSRNHHLRAADAQGLLAQTSQTVTTTAGTFTSVNACEALVALQRRGFCRSPSTTGITHQPSPDYQSVTSRP